METHLKHSSIDIIGIIKNNTKMLDIRHIIVI